MLWYHMFSAQDSAERSTNGYPMIGKLVCVVGILSFLNIYENRDYCRQLELRTRAGRILWKVQFVDSTLRKQTRFNSCTPFYLGAESIHGGLFIVYFLQYFLEGTLKGRSTFALSKKRGQYLSEVVEQCGVIKRYELLRSNHQPKYGKNFLRSHI